MVMLEEVVGRGDVYILITEEEEEFLYTDKLDTNIVK